MLVSIGFGNAAIPTTGRPSGTCVWHNGVAFTVPAISLAERHVRVAQCPTAKSFILNDVTQRGTKGNTL